MLGQDLTAHLEACHQVVPADLPEVDITVPRVIERTVHSTHPDVVIHAAAFTAVDDCERYPEKAFLVNAQGTRHVALACRQARIPMLYISTDYVFDGEKPAPYVESDRPSPINIYGQSKLEGERHVIELVERSWIVRTSWLFGPQGKNFVKTVLNMAQRGESLRVVNDQVGAPTYTMDLAEMLRRIVEKGGPGIYHVTNQGYCSWYEFAREVVRQAGLRQAEVSPIPTSAAGRLARRPRNSRLENARLRAEGLDISPPWQDALRRYLMREAQVKG